MPTIPEEEIRSLEAKIQTEVQKIFAQFLEDLERTGSDTQETTGFAKTRIPGQVSGPDPAKPARGQAKPGKRRAPKKFTKMDTLLTGPAPGGRKSSATLLEEDMDKILRRRYRRGTN
jgi:hypothetical protein